MNKIIVGQSYNIFDKKTERTWATEIHNHQVIIETAALQIDYFFSHTCLNVTGDAPKCQLEWGSFPPISASCLDILVDYDYMFAS
ncbi:hypothetical protein ACJX0J_031763, partial [Zea mays]